LGLAVVDGIVRSQDGHITVASEIGQGTTFTLYFPAQAADVSLDQTVSPRLTAGHGERILLVDDEMAITSSLRRMLARLNYQVTVSNHPRAAVSLFQQNPAAFDLVMTDFTMPEMSGLELARELHALKPELPIILASGLIPELQRAELQAAGIVEILAKPVMIDGLAELLRRILQPPRLAPEAALGVWH
jgi:CheY-like chemotaxis protein